MDSFQKRQHRMQPQNIDFVEKQQPRLTLRETIWNTQGIASPMSLSDHNQMASPIAMSNRRQPYQELNDLKRVYNWNSTFKWNAVEATPPVPLDAPLRLSSLSQLQGNYKDDTPSGSDIINVVIAGGSGLEGRSYGIVRRICNNEEALLRRFICEESTQFTLCSTNGCVEAVISKGANLKNCVKWYSNDGRVIAVWRRIKETFFHPTPVNPPVSRNSSSRLDTLGSCSESSKSSSKDLMEFRRSVRSNSSSPELNRQYSRMRFFDSDRQTSSNTNHCRSSADAKKSNQQGDALFELIKAQCNTNPWLMKKIVEWGISQSSQYSQITRENALKLSQGRLWVNVRSTRSDDENDDGFQDALDYLKGAYQEYEEGVYTQPKPQGSEPVIQHRLLKSSIGLWMIEKHDFEGGVWRTCAREQPDGRWEDLKHNRMIEVRLLPLLRILEKLREGGATYREIEKNVDFLFTSCNQKKLNGKLKTRNLKHNISNLKTKLEKQYALSFAVLVANTADVITQSTGI